MKSVIAFQFRRPLQSSRILCQNFKRLNHNHVVFSTETHRQPNHVENIKELLHRYDVFILDQFGVLHDGVNPLPGVSAALELLRQEKKAAIVLSNTSSRSKSAIKRFSDIGLPLAFDEFLTSGEYCHDYMKKELAGKKCTWFTWKTFPTDSTLAANNISPTDVTEADFLFFHGTQSIVSSFNVDQSIETTLFKDGNLLHPEIDRVLSIAASRKIPAICANVDRTAVSAGRTFYMPGLLMEEYRKKGGHVITFGKPSKEFFDFAMERAKLILNQEIDKARIIHVGDSLHHDILGKLSFHV